MNGQTPDTQPSCDRTVSLSGHFGFRISDFGASRVGRRHSALRIRHSAFSLTEMVVVIGIIVLLLAATIPGLSSLWAERKNSEIVTTLSGALANARALALNGRDRGLFFCVVDNIQKAYPIERYDDLENLKGAVPTISANVADRFRITAGTVLTFPEPLRVVPRDVLDNPSDPSTWLVWQNTELVNADYRAITLDEPQRHRNFFTVIFRSDGRQEIGANVVIYDCDSCNLASSADGLGDVTGLPIGIAASYDDFSATAGIAGDAAFDGGPAAVSLEDLIVDSSNTEAINFVSVDALLVYDEREFSDPIYPDADTKRAYLVAEGQPLYISRNSGKVIVGPSGEN